MYYLSPFMHMYLNLLTMLTVMQFNTSMSMYCTCICAHKYIVVQFVCYTVKPVLKDTPSPLLPETVVSQDRSPVTGWFNCIHLKILVPAKYMVFQDRL